MKSTIKLFLIIALFVSTAVADESDISNNGCMDEGDMGNGGRTCTSSCETDPAMNEPCEENSDEENSILSDIQNYLDTLFG